MSVRKFSVVLLCLWLTSCSSKSVKSPEVYGPGGTEGQSPEPKKMEGAPVKPPEIGLVVGGAGVCSFATIGLLKQFQKAKIKIEFIIASGWTAPFAAAYGFSKSIHDAEWVASHLEEKDLRVKNEGTLPTAKLHNIWGERTLETAKPPVIIWIPESERGPGRFYEREVPDESVALALSLPGLFQSFPANQTPWIQTYDPLPVEEALRRTENPVVAVSCYGDYIDFVRKEGETFGDGFAKHLEQTLRQSLNRAPLLADIRLGKSADDFTAKRAAILAGNREGEKLVPRIRRLWKRK